MILYVHIRSKKERNAIFLNSLNQQIGHNDATLNESVVFLELSLEMHNVHH